MVPLINAGPLPIWGKIEYPTGEAVDGALINISSSEGSITVYSGSDGYWQADLGDPLNWPVDTQLNLSVKKIGDQKIWVGNATAVLGTSSIEIGPIVLATDGSIPSDPDDSNQSLRPVAMMVNHGFFESRVNQTVFFDGVDSYDPDGTITGYRWDFNGDGLFGTQWLDNGVVTHVYNKPGFYRIILEVRDEMNHSDSTEGLVDVSTDPSMVEIIGPDEGLTSEMNTFIYQLSQPKTILNVTWMVDDEVVSYDSMVHHQFKSTGYHFIKVMVMDDLDQSFHDAHQIYIDLDTDADQIPNAIEDQIDTPIWTKNNATEVIIEGVSHLLIDTDQDGRYDLFFNTTAMNSSQLKEKDESLLIDDDLDDSYEYQYLDGTISSYVDSDENKRDNGTPGFSFVAVLIGMVLY
jgi:PKD repeat protein